MDSTRPKTGPLSRSQGAWITGELRAVRILLTDRDEAWQLVRVLTLVVRIPDFVVQVHWASVCGLLIGVRHRVAVTLHNSLRVNAIVVWVGCIYLLSLLNKVSIRALVICLKFLIWKFSLHKARWLALILAWRSSISLEANFVHLHALVLEINHVWMHLRYLALSIHD